jgi:hypothetical protein
MSAFGVTSDISANQGSSFNFRLLRTLLAPEKLKL